MKPIQTDQRKIANIRDEAAFEPYDPETERGTFILKLNEAMPRDVGSYLCKMDPGAQSTPRRHGGAEEFLMLEGELIDNDGTVYRPGDVIWLAPETEHSSRTETGCLVAVFAEAGEEAPDEAG